MGKKGPTIWQLEIRLLLLEEQPLRLYEQIRWNGASEEKRPAKEYYLVEEEYVPSTEYQPILLRDSLTEVELSR